MMQMDDDVGKISQATPILIGKSSYPKVDEMDVGACINRCSSYTCAGRAMELFLEKLCRQAITVAQSRQAKTLTPSHL